VIGPALLVIALLFLIPGAGAEEGSPQPGPPVEQPEQLAPPDHSRRGAPQQSASQPTGTETSVADLERGYEEIMDDIIAAWERDQIDLYNDRNRMRRTLTDSCKRLHQQTIALRKAQAAKEGKEYKPPVMLTIEGLKTAKDMTQLLYRLSSPADLANLSPHNLKVIRVTDIMGKMAEALTASETREVQKLLEDKELMEGILK